MRVKNEDVYRELAKLSKSAITRMVYAKNHAKWYKQAKKKEQLHLLSIGQEIN